MRRAKLKVDDKDNLIDLLAEIEYGVLGLVGPDGWPQVRPVNFVYLDDVVYFHGAKKGEKMDVLANDDRVTFVAVKDFAVIPSHFTHDTLACPATQFYKTVMIRGRTRLVEDRPEKARALQAMMEKLQPEGGHAPITADDPRYDSALNGPAVIAIAIESMVGKFKLGQDYNAKFAEKIKAGLAARGCPIDHATLEAMTRAKGESTK